MRSSAPPAVSPWNIANALTVLRLLLVPLLAWLILYDGGNDTVARLAASATFALGMATDRLDGHLARSRGLVTSFGKVADPIADKAFTGTAFVGLSLIGELPWWVTVVVIARELAVTLLRLAVIRHGVIPASRGGKAKTGLQALGLGLFLLPLPGAVEPVAWTVMAAAVVVTVVTGVDYVVRAVRLRRTSQRTADRARRRPAS